MTQPTIELLPCPFCGSAAKFFYRQIGVKGTMGSDWWHSVQCMKCNAAVGYDDNRYRDKTDALKAWNTRDQSAHTLPLDEVPEGWMFQGIYCDREGVFTAELCSVDMDGFGFPLKIMQCSGATPVEALRAAIAKTMEVG